MNLYLNYFSANYIFSSLVLLLLLVYLLQVQNKDRASWILIFYFASNLTVPLGFVLFYSNVDVAVSSGAATVINCLIFSVLILLYFSYSFQGNPYPRESFWIMLLSLPVGVFAYLHWLRGWYQGGQYFNFNTHLFVAVEEVRSQALFSLVVIIMMLWVVIVFIRKTLHYSEYKGAFSQLRDEYLNNQIIRMILLVPNGLSRMFYVRGRKARALQNFAIAIFVTFLNGSLFAVYSNGFISWQLYQSVLSVGTILLYFIYAIIYINYSPQPTSFMVKIVGISLVALMILFIGAGRSYFSEHEKVYDLQRLHDLEKVKDLLEKGELDSRPESIAYIAELKSHSNLFERDYELIWSRDKSFSSGELKRADLQMKAIHMRANIRRLVSFQNISHDKAKEKALYVSGVTGFEKNKRYYKYSDLDDSDSYFVYYSLKGDDGRLYEIGFSYLDYRKNVHPVTRNFIYYLLGGTLFILILFPFFFRGNLVNPLNQLLAGVRAVNAGDLSVNVPVIIEDEIGFLSRSFNKMVQSIRDFNAVLEDRVQERTSQLEDANIRLKELDEIKNKLFTNISHEIRTPLTLILAPLDSLLKERDDFTAQQVALLYTIQDSGRRLLKLINDLLDLARFDAGKMNLEYEHIELGKFIGTVAAYFEPIAATRGLVFNVDVTYGVFVYADGEKLEKIVLNLLSNAFKFTVKGNVTVRAHTQGNEIHIYVSDTGIGIQEENQGIIFERFRQVDSELSRKYEGTGIGLALSREIAFLHGGDISLKSRPGLGSTFHVKLPLITEHEIISKSPVLRTHSHNDSEANYASTVLKTHRGFQAEAKEGNYVTPLAENKGGKEQKILIVEDNQDLKHYIANVLSQDFIILQAENGREGLAVALKHMPDIILSDVMMPEMDGLEMLRKMKEDDGLMLIPFLFLSAKADIHDRLEGLEYGADDYIAKPFQPDELRLKIRNLLHRSSQFELNVMKEREHIYANLHDYLGGSLTDLAMLTQRLKSSLAGDEELIKELEENVQDTVRSYKQCFLEVEDLNILKEDFLDGIQLVLLRRYANFSRQIEFSGERGLKAIFLNRNNDQIKQTVYSVCLEIATNDLKYGKGISSWNLALEEGDQPVFKLSMKAESDYEQLRKRSGHGTVNIQERIKSVGGNIESKVSEGRFILEIEVGVVR